MAKAVSTTVRINPELSAMIDQVQKKLVLEVLPNALRLASVPVDDAVVAKLQEHDSRNPKPGSPQGTKAKQSKITRARFQYHMVDRVRTKLVKDDYGVLAITGVDDKGRHARIDHGDKAKTVGRNHIMWGKRPDPPILRRQKQDIPLQVEAETKDTVVRIVGESIKRAVQTGEL